MMELHEGGRRRGVIRDVNDLLRFRNEDLFVGSGGTVKNTVKGSDGRSSAGQMSTDGLRDSPENLRDVYLQKYAIYLDYVNFFFLEFAASYVLISSSFYVPEQESDYLKQYVPSLAIIAVIMCMKDRRYFCPDGTFMVSVVMLSSGAYDNKTFWVKWNWHEFLCRLFGQLFGFLAVIGTIVPNEKLFKHSLLNFGYIPTVTIGSASNATTTGDVIGVKDAIHFENRVAFEFICTFVECISVSFALMPLLKVTSDDNDPSRYTTKFESLPPKNKDLWFAAVCLGLIHYVLERIFRVTMNPFVVGLQAWVEGSAPPWDRMLFQIFGLGAASVYCLIFKPSLKVLKSLVSDG